MLKQVKRQNSNNDVETHDPCKSEEQIERGPEEEERISEFNVEGDADLTEIVEMQPLSSEHLQNENSSDHEIQILALTDDESQTELEVLEENLQPSDDIHSSNDVGQKSRKSGGFFKEYQAMLEDADDYLEDNNSMDSKTNEMHSFGADEEILEDTEVHMKSIEQENIVEEHDADASKHAQSTTENIEATEKEAKGRTRKTQNRTNNRSSSTRIAKKGEGLNTSNRYVCFKCNRDFSTKTNLNRHMATHEGNRAFQCHICDKTFTQNVSLKQHMYTHTGEKPYQCVVCHRGFTQCKSLVFHMRRHTGEKPFPCEKCGALFRQKDGLKTHILKRHTIKSQQGDVEIITCAICKEVLADKNSLHEHMKKHLNDYVRVDSAMSCANREANIEENDNNNILLDYIDDDPLNDKSGVIIDDSAQGIAADISSSAHVVDLMTTSALEPSRAKKYQCRICFKCFAIKINLIRHLTTHKIDVASEEFLCKLCELCFTSSEELRAHTMSEHKVYESGSQAQKSCRIRAIYNTILNATQYPSKPLKTRNMCIKCLEETVKRLQAMNKRGSH
ncbi:PREDICTED: myoneurin-like [Rhagoletis zephyria]|uniref:myoneurin-like n=1 Tax=Rhagoletis zephyria TaxID=28612 RepID=UPI0008115764|nr:PREDICTED: myoneurin-like [Rhagoletis zephyria]